MWRIFEFGSVEKTWTRLDNAGGSLPVAAAAAAGASDSASTGPEPVVSAGTADDDVALRNVSSLHGAGGGREGGRKLDDQDKLRRSTVAARSREGLAITGARAYAGAECCQIFISQNLEQGHQLRPPLPLCAASRPLLPLLPAHWRLARSSVFVLLALPFNSLLLGKALTHQARYPW